MLTFVSYNFCSPLVIALEISLFIKSINVTGVKLSWSQPMDSWTEEQHTRMLLSMSLEPCAVTKKVWR